MQLAPIVLFVYNRPWHTQQTLYALKNNDLADQSILYILSDGPKENESAEQIGKIRKVREVIKRENWCKEVHIVESDKNKGLADSIISGVTRIVNQYGRIIVLEDDIVTSYGFLKYMNDALKMYEKDEKVMHVSGYMFPVKGKLSETFFYKQASCWGWGTWKESWNKLELSPNLLYREVVNSLSYEEINIDGTNQFMNQLMANVEGRIKTWAVYWHFSVILNNGLCLHPRKSLTRNIGNDGSGVNCGVTDIFNGKLAKSITIEKIKIKDEKKVYLFLKTLYKKSQNQNKAKKKRWSLKKIVPSTLKYRIKYLIDENFRKYEDEKKRLDELPRYTETEIGFLGKKIKIADIDSFRFMKHEIFEKQIYNFNCASVKPYIVDCGANIGLSVIYFKRLFPNCEIVAFEPDDKIFAILNYNIKEVFGYEDVKLLKKACWNDETTLKFLSEGADGGRKAMNDEVKNVIEVETIRLRSFLNRKVDFLKIDIEGAEVEVIADIKQELQHVENLFVEFHSFINREQGLPEILYILKEAGFRLHLAPIGIQASQPFIHIPEYASMDNQINIFGYRNH